jgi:hypothetical protein
MIVVCTMSVSSMQGKSFQELSRLGGPPKVSRQPYQSYKEVETYPVEHAFFGVPDLPPHSTAPFYMNF